MKAAKKNEITISQESITKLKAIPKPESKLLFHAFIWAMVWYVLRDGNKPEHVVVALEKLEKANYHNKRMTEAEIMACVSDIEKAEDKAKCLCNNQEKFTQLYSCYRSIMLLKTYSARELRSELMEVAEGLTPLTASFMSTQFRNMGEIKVELEILTPPVLKAMGSRPKKLDLKDYVELEPKYAKSEITVNGAKMSSENLAICFLFDGSQEYKPYVKYGAYLF